MSAVTLEDISNTLSSTIGSRPTTPSTTTKKASFTADDGTPRTLSRRPSVADEISTLPPHIRNRKYQFNSTPDVKFSDADIQLQKARNLAFTRREEKKLEQLRKVAEKKTQDNSEKGLMALGVFWLIVVLVVGYLVGSAVHRGRSAPARVLTAEPAYNPYPAFTNNKAARMPQKTRAGGGY